ncbi:RNA methyltransferase [Streptomyces sp. NBC_00726]|uniref:TrmH family RNA methyltransferase n=1 Tax=Streptomyces sp. NBC_00726 TaxID=2903674 RepID=UPI00386E4582
MFEHLRHKPGTPLLRNRELVIACSAFRSRVNLSSVVRTAGCCGVERIIACGNVKLDPKIARDGADNVEIEMRRSLPPVLKKMREDGYTVIALEQATNSKSLHEISFPRKSVIVLGNERTGLKEDELACVDECVEIPVWGSPHSYNVATAGAMAMYEYCRQFPTG